MNRLGITIAIALGVVLLLCIVLEHLGMGDVVKKAGLRVREKSGLTASVEIPESPKETTAQIEKLLGFPIRQIRTRPIEAKRIAKEKILAEIDGLKDLQIKAKGVELEADSRIRENGARRKELLAILDQAKVVVDNPQAEYPAKVGNYVYASRGEVLAVAAKIRKEADYLEAESQKLVNVPNSAIKNDRALRQYIERLEWTLKELDVIPILATGAELDNEVLKLRETIPPWEIVPRQIGDGIPAPKEDGISFREPTEEENYQKAFGQ